MFLHPYYTPNEHNCTRKKSEMLLLQQRKSQNTIDTHIKLKFCSQPRHIRAGGIFYLCFLCAPAGGNTGEGVRFMDRRAGGRRVGCAGCRRVQRDYLFWASRRLAHNSQSCRRGHPAPPLVKRLNMRMKQFFISSVSTKSKD